MAAYSSDGGRVVLVVDDEPGIAILVAETLRRRGLRVRTATDPIHALETVEELGNRLGLVISDVVMPGLFGTDMIRCMLQRYPKLPVLLMTGYMDKAQALSKAEGYRFPILRKPFSLDELAAAAGAMLGSDSGSKRRRRRSEATE